VIPAGDERTSDGGEAAVRQPAREQLMSVRRVDRTDALILAVDGAVDGLTAPRLCRAIDVAFDELDGRPLVVDLTEVTFFGSAGLRTMAESADHAAIRPGFEPLRVVVDHNRPVLRPMEIVGLDAVLTLFYTVAEAIEGQAAG
jgi:anti-sigma B factor antagonist